MLSEHGTEKIANINEQFKKALRKLMANYHLDAISKTFEVTISFEQSKVTRKSLHEVYERQNRNKSMRIFDGKDKDDLLTQATV